MDPLALDQVFGAISMAFIVSALVVWFALWSRWKQRGVLLEYEPRQPVPWGAVAPGFAVLFVAMSLLATVFSQPRDEHPEPAGPLEISQGIMAILLMQSVVIGVSMGIAAVYRASQRDLGLPTYADELARDVGIGLVACLAALVPVYGVQALLVWLAGPSEHPLVEMVTRGEPNVGVILLASVATVVLAPVSEEILFRLLLQGWLEKWESRWHEQLANSHFRFRFRVKHLLVLTAVLAIALTLLMWNILLTLPLLLVMMLATGLFLYSQYKQITANDELNNLSSYSSDSTAENGTVPPVPAAAGTWPYGWPSILVSSLLFAVAHWGYGPDPVAIFLLALVLGYVYQRTHRIVPCIVAHAAFNAVATAMLWYMVLQNLD